MVQDALARDENQVEMDFQYCTPTGETKWLLLRCEIQVTAGQPSKAVGVVADITTRKKHEEQTQILLRELLHRTNNMLAVVQGIASQTLRTTPDLDSFRKGFTARLQSLSESNRLLVDSNFSGSSLFELVKRQLSPFVGDGTQQLSLVGDNLTLKPEAVANLGLAFHELATNAVKYGALATSDGKIIVSCRLQGDEAKIEWAELGGPAPKDTERKGFGRYVIETLAARSFDGSAEFKLLSEGARWSLVFRRESATVLRKPP
jgi:two-component system CheB/CheR fusion protein